MAIRISGLSSGMDTEAMVQDLVKAYKTKGNTYQKNQTRQEWKKDAWAELNKKVKAFNSKYIANMQYSTYYNKRTTTVSDSSKASVVAADGAVTSSQTLEVEQLAKTAYMTGSKIAATSTDATLGSLGYQGSGKIEIQSGSSAQPLTFDIHEDTKIKDIVECLKAAGYNASYDTNNQRFFVSAKESGAGKDFNFGGDTNALKTLGLSTTDGAVKINGQDAKIKLNGAEFNSNSNTFNINGLTITAKNLTDHEVTINTDTDYQAVYNNIKSFIKDYNELIKEMDKLYNAPTNKGYDPLTDDEKEVLTDSEVEKWESKVKEALLRKDSNLASLSNAYKSNMLQTYSINGKSYSLASLGITTGNYFTTSVDERNTFHIDGDEDDSTVSGEQDKLMTAITSDPNGVTGFFTELSKNLYTQLNNMSKSSSTRSFGNFYDDKAMTSAVSTAKEKVDKWENYVKEVEDKYYKKFAKMESMLSTLNSQQSYISNMFGF